MLHGIEELVGGALLDAGADNHLRSKVSLSLSLSLSPSLAMTLQCGRTALEIFKGKLASYENNEWIKSRTLHIIQNRIRVELEVSCSLLNS